MPFTGATFSILTNTWYPAVEDTVMESADSNSVLEDIANGLTQVLTRDGSGTMSGDLNMGNNKITNLDSATNPGDAPRFDQVQPVDATLTAIAALSFDATNNLMYSTGADTFALLASTAAGRAFLTYVDPGADKIPYWKDADGTIANIAFSTGLSFTGGTLTLSTNLQTYSGITPSANVQSFLGAADYSAMRTLLSLGTAALKNTGTSGNTVPLLDGANTWSAAQLFQGNLTISKATPNLTLVGTSTNIPAIELKNASRYDDIRNTTSGLSLRYDTSNTPKEMLWNGTNLTLNSVAVPTISSSDTLSNKTLSSPTVSGTIAGSPSVSGAWSFGANVTFTNPSGHIYQTMNAAAGHDSCTIYSAGGASKWLVGRGATLGTDDFAFYSYAVGIALKLMQATGELIGISVGPSSVYSMGYRGCPYNNQNTSYTFALTDAGAFVFANVGGPFTYTVPPNSSVAFPIGTTIIVGCGNGISLSIAEGSGVTIYRFDGVSGTGTRTVAPNGAVTLYKFGTNTWLAMGNISA